LIALNSPQLSRRTSHLAQDSHHTEKRQRNVTKQNLLDKKIAN